MKNLIEITSEDIINFDYTIDKDYNSKTLVITNIKKRIYLSLKLELYNDILNKDKIRIIDNEFLKEVLFTIISIRLKDSYIDIEGIA